MTNFLLFGAIACCAAWFLFFNAGELVNELNWANTLCSATGTLCRNPQPLSLAAGGFAFVWFLVKFVSLIRD